MTTSADLTCPVCGELLDEAIRQSSLSIGDIPGYEVHADVNAAINIAHQHTPGGG